LKFTDGYWLLREGVTAAHPVEVLDVTASPGALEIHAPTQPIRHRGDLLKGPVVTISAHAPTPDVIGVTFTHFEGEQLRGPRFEVRREDDFTPQVEYDDEHATVTAGALSVRVARTGPWHVDFLAHGRILTTSGRKGMGIMRDATGAHYLREQLDLRVGTSVYGLGERFGPLAKNGQVVDMWNADGGTATEQAYKNVPFFLTDAGYGVFVDHPGKVSFEVGSEAVSRVQFSVESQQLTYYVIYGPTPKDILRKYTALTGRPALPPAWSFGLWLSTSFTTSYDEATVTSFIDGMKERELPLSVFHFDCFWMREFNWCDFQWDPRVFPDPEGMLARLKDKGLHICVWINPYIAQRSPLFAEGKALGHLLKKPDGSVWQWDLWQPGMALVDFTSPAARDWYASKLEALLAQGVDCFKTDFGERIPVDVAYAYYASTAASRRPSSSRARPRPGASASRCTGAATARPRTSRWPSRCAAASASVCLVSGSGAMTSGASRAPRPRRCSSGGSPSGCCPRTAGCTARRRTGCRGCSTRRPWTS
jgi:alpha-D-xyloside xylohydrolase